MLVRAGLGHFAPIKWRMVLPITERVYRELLQGHSLPWPPAPQSPTRGGRRKGMLVSAQKAPFFMGLPHGARATQPGVGHHVCVYSRGGARACVSI